MSALQINLQKVKKPLIISLSIVATLLLVNVASWLDLFALRFVFPLRGERSSFAKVIIVALDAESQRHFGIGSSEKWPRELQAKIIDRARELGARGIVMDMGYRSEEQLESDQKLENAFASIPTVLAAEVPRTASQRGEKTIMLPPPRFRNAAQSVGHTNLEILANALWSFPKSLAHESELVLPIYLQAARLSDKNAQAPESDTFINFYGPVGTIPTVSAKTFLNPEFKNSEHTPLFSNALIFIGLVDSVRKSVLDERIDWVRTGYSAHGFPGVEAHATMTANVLEGSWIRRLPVTTEFLICSVVTALASFLILGYSNLLAIFCALIIFIGWFFSSVWLLREYYLFLPSITPMLGALVATLGGKFILDDRMLRAHHKQILASFSAKVAKKYIDPADLSSLRVVHPNGIVIATDIEGYAATRNSLTTTQLEEFEELYRQTIAAVLFDRDPNKRGILVKFGGDAVLAYFPEGDRANALTKALNIDKEINALKPQLIAKGFPFLKLRIGLAQGEVRCGLRKNLTGGSYFDITSGVGSDAARLEALNKASGTSIAITKNLLDSLGDASTSFLFLGRGALNQGDSKLEDVYVAVASDSISPVHKDRWTSLLQMIASVDSAGISGLLKEPANIKQSEFLTLTNDFKVLLSTKEHPLISFATPLLTQFNQNDLLSLLVLFFQIGAQDPQLKQLAASYIYTINYLLDPKESVRHLPAALKNLEATQHRA